MYLARPTEGLGIDSILVLMISPNSFESLSLVDRNQLASSKKLEWTCFNKNVRT